MTNALKSELNQIIHNEIAYLSRYTSHPIIHKDIDAVWVFSGPGTFFKPLDSGEPQFMAWMDRYRILYGIVIVKKVVAARLSKRINDVTESDIRSSGPIFIYNGIPSENIALRKALKGSISILPTEKVRIVDAVNIGDSSKPIGNTLDQIKSFPRDEIGKRIFHRIAIVSHAAHLSRIIRYLKKYEIFPSTVVVELFPVKESDKTRMLDAKEETEKIWRYFQKGDLSWDPFPAEV